MNPGKWHVALFRNIFRHVKQGVLSNVSKETTTLTVLVRMNPQRGRNAFLYTVFLCLFITGSSLLSLSIMLSLSLEGIPFKLWHDLGGGADRVFPSLFNPQHLSTTQGFYVLATWFYIFLFALGILLAILSRRALRELKLLRTFSRLDPSQIHDFQIGKYLSITYPLWFHTQVIEAPSPKHLLDVLKEREGLDDEWVAKTIATLEPDVEEERSEQRFLISLTDCATLSMIGPVETPEPLQFTSAQATLVGFLATDKKGAWVPKEEVVSMLYGPDSDTNINVLRKRVNTAAFDYLQKAGLLDTESEEGTLSHMELIEIELRGNKSFWRLNAACDVAAFAELGRFYQSICNAEIQQEGASAFTLEDLRIACEQNQQTYGNGYLSKYFQMDSMPHWAQQHYRDHRDRWLGILTYAIKRVKKHLDDREPGKERNEMARTLARLYAQKALAETGAVPLSSYGEQDLVRCLNILRTLKNLRVARDMCREYIAHRRVIDKTWDVSDALYNIWPDVFNRLAYRSKEE